MSLQQGRAQGKPEVTAIHWPPPCLLRRHIPQSGRGPALEASQSCPEPENPPCPGGSRLETVSAAAYLPLLHLSPQLRFL